MSKVVTQDSLSNFGEVKTGTNHEGMDIEVNLQPEKIVEVFRFEDGSKTYRVRWKDTWIHEQLISSYQYIVDEYWEKNPLVEDESEKVVERLIENDTEKKEDNIECKEPPKKKIDTPKEENLTSDTSLDHQYVRPPKDIGNVIEPQENGEDDGDDVESDDNDDDDDEDNDDDCDDNDADDNDNDIDGDELEFIANENESKISHLCSNERKDHVNPSSDLSSSSSSSSSDRKRKKTSDYEKHSKKYRGRPPKENEVLKSDSGSSKENEEQSSSDDKVNENAINRDQKDLKKSKDVKKGRNKKDKYSYPDDKGPCTCDICGKVISNKYGLREHQTVVHFKNGKFGCEICGKRVTNKRALNLHMTSHSNARTFVCSQCGSSHKTKGNLNYHIKTMHEMIKNFRCDICFKTFKVQAELKDHCLTQHANEGKITCIVCKKKLTTALSIYTHSVMHSGAREFECDICGYAFKTLTGLKEHKVTHLEHKPVRVCPHCGRKFYSRSQYNAHVMRHTDDGSLITYKCPVCDVKFQHKSSYNRHVIRHQPGGDLQYPKENPYLLLDETELPDGVCHKCRKYYASKSGFYLHLKKCRDGIVQQYQCPFCDSCCSNRSSLKRHIQRRHKDVDFEGQVMPGNGIAGKENEDGDIEIHQRNAVLSPESGMQFQGPYFEHGYGNQINGNEMVATVNTSQLSSVDVQLLIDTAAAAAAGAQGDQTTHIISNMRPVTNPNDAPQNLQLLSENEAVQFTAQLTQQGVIVRSSDMAHDQGQNQQSLIVSSAHIDAQTGQLLLSENQAAQIIANAQALRESQLTEDSRTLTLQGNDAEILRDGTVLQFNNRAAVIQIHPHETENIMSSHQVISIPNQHIQENTVDGNSVQIQQPLQTITNNAIQVTEIDSSDSIHNNIHKDEKNQASDIANIKTLHLVENTIQNREMSDEVSSTKCNTTQCRRQEKDNTISFEQLEQVNIEETHTNDFISNRDIDSTVISEEQQADFENLDSL